MKMHEHIPELTECRDCGSTFDLARQYYYDNLCPTCKREQDGEGAINPVIGPCSVCGDDVRKNEQVWSQQAAAQGVRGEVLVCPDHKDYQWTPSRGV